MTADQETVRKSAKIEEILSKAATSRVLRIDSEYLLPSTYIIESPSAMRILLEPWMVGARLANLARESSADFIRAAFDLVPELQEVSLSSFTEVVPLAGALYYSMAEAFACVFGETISRCFIGARRHLTSTGWKTDLSYKNFEALPPSPVILIGDTIATGGTIESIIDATLSQASDVRAIVVYAIAGGLLGAIRLKELADKIEPAIYTFYSNAIFGVEANGTDMPWLHPGTIVTSETKQKAEEVYGSDLARRWCCIWDWGDRAKHPLRHLEELLERCDEELTGALDHLTREKVTEFRRETMDALKRWQLPLSVSEKPAE
ncbi:MAG: phosphoribosyltransferase [Candidatus Thorarchaeota archaeon]